MQMPWSERRTDTMALLAMVKQELQPLRDDLATIRAELRDALGQTYSREMVDQMFVRMHEEVQALREDQEEMRKDTIDHRELMWSRAGILFSVAYVILNLLPHLGAFLKP